MSTQVSNIVKLQHSDTNLLHKVMNGFNTSGILNTLIPIPLDVENARTGIIGYSDIYEFCLKEWGTMHDVGADNQQARLVDDYVLLEFNTNKPPYEVFERLVEFGFDVVAHYYDAIEGYCGIWDNNIDDYYDISGLTSNAVRYRIDPILDNMFGIVVKLKEHEKVKNADLEVV